MKTKKLLSKIISVALVMALLLQMAPTAFAASREYISEIRIANASDGQAAINALTEAGYTVLDGDLNEGTGKCYTYLGYKTTTDAADAITDLKLLNMNSGFTTNDGEAAMKQMYADFKKDAEYMMHVVEKFRNEYNAESPYAKAAYLALNSFKYSIDVDIEEEILGDYLLNKATIDDLIQLMFFVEPAVRQAFYNIMALGILETGHTSWMDRAVANILDTEREYSDEEMDRADEIYKYVLAFGEFYRENVKSLEEDNNITEEDLTDTDVINIMPFVAFHSRTFNDTDLAEYLINPDIEWEQVLPIAAAITDEQVTLIEVLGIMSFEPQGIDTEDALNDFAEKTRVDEPVSVWEGIDRQLLKEPVGITLNAGMESQLGGTEDPLYVALSGGAREVALSGVVGGLMIMVMAELFADSVAGVNAARSALSAGRAAIKAATTSQYSVMAGVSRLIKGGATAQTLAKANAAVDNFAAIAQSNRGVVNAAECRLAQTTANAGKAIRYSRYIGIGVIVVMSVISAAMIGKNLADYYNPDYTDIPYTLFDVKMNEAEEATYIKYHAALTPGGDKADLNGFQGRTWTAMYATKDTEMGKPITADMLVKKTGWSETVERPENYDKVSVFGYNTPGNLNLGVFDSKYAVYMFFMRDMNYSPVTGSVFGDSPFTMITIGVGILLLGGALGAGGMYMFGKRRKKEDIAAVAVTDTAG